MRAAFVLALICLAAPFTATAQQIVPETDAHVRPRVLLVDDLLLGSVNQGFNSPLAARIVPIWSSPDGRILASVAWANPSTAPALPAGPFVGSPLDWNIVDVTSMVAGALRWRLNESLHAKASLQQVSLVPSYTRDNQLWCTQAAFGPACFTSSALAGGQSDDGSRLVYGNIGAGWTYGRLSLDLDYGLSWLRNPGATPNVTDAFAGSALVHSAAASLPMLIVPGVNGLSSTLEARGRWQLDAENSFDIGSSLGRFQLNPTQGGIYSSFNQAALSFALNRGAFSGVIVGRALSPTTPLIGTTPHWVGIDLGVSWRTPWQGELSVGAQNLWSTGVLPSLLDPSHDNDAGQARVPYVQYHQDL